MPHAGDTAQCAGKIRLGILPIRLISLKFQASWLEAILNFQTMVAEPTGMDIANGSLLDEATGCRRAMMMAFDCKTKHVIFRVDADTQSPQTIAILETRDRPLGIEINIAPAGTGYDENIFGALIVIRPARDRYGISKAKSARSYGQGMTIVQVTCCTGLS